MKVVKKNWQEECLTLKIVNFEAEKNVILSVFDSLLDHNIFLNKLEKYGRKCEVN